MKKLAVAGIAFSVLLVTACSDDKETSAQSEKQESVKPVSENEQDKTMGGVDADRESGPAIEINVEGLLKPNSEITVTTPCLEGDDSAKAENSFGDTFKLERQKEGEKLSGSFTAPQNIGPGPFGGPHTVTVTCDSGANSTIEIPSAGNGES